VELPELEDALATTKIFQPVTHKHVRRGQTGSRGHHVQPHVVVEFSAGPVTAPMEPSETRVPETPQKRERVRLTPALDGATGPNGLTVTPSVAEEPAPPTENASTEIKVNVAASGKKLSLKIVIWLLALPGPSGASLVDVPRLAEAV
jgi:hypothetical protein